MTITTSDLDPQDTWTPEMRSLATETSRLRQALEDSLSDDQADQLEGLVLAFERMISATRDWALGLDEPGLRQSA